MISLLYWYWPLWQGHPSYNHDFATIANLPKVNGQPSVTHLHVGFTLGTSVDTNYQDLNASNVAEILNFDGQLNGWQVPPNTPGNPNTLGIPNATILSELASVRASGTKLIAWFTGLGNSDIGPRTPFSTSQLVVIANYFAQWLQANGFSGVDVDDEYYTYVNSGTDAQFVAFIAELRAAFNETYTISIPFYAYITETLLSYPEAMIMMDYGMDMTYEWPPNIPSGFDVSKYVYGVGMQQDVPYCSQNPSQVTQFFTNAANTAVSNHASGVGVFAVIGGALITAPGCPAPNTTISTVFAPYQCTPQCTNKMCGSDGCEGSCGVCSANETCLPSSQCCNCAGCQAQISEYIRNHWAYTSWPDLSDCKGCPVVSYPNQTSC